jgi:outer membrane protein OmpA-like peptidoglycan-associated protein
MRRPLPLLVLVLAGALGACGSTPPARTPGTPAAAVAAATPPATTARTVAAELSTEQQWLQTFFGGTPVRIVQRDDGALLIDVPREFCFDPGRSTVKPALGAVLDKVAESLRRRPAAQLALLAAPDDKAATTPLALRRAASVQKHLRDRGVPGTRLGEPSVTTAAAVQLRLGAALSDARP